MGEEVDPARMHQIKSELDASGVYLAEEVERFCTVYCKPKPKQSAMDHQAMHAALDPAVSRFTVLQDENAEIFVRFMNDLPFQKVVTEWMASEAYTRFRSGTSGSP